MHHVMVVVPIDREVDKAKYVAQYNRYERDQGVQFISMRHLKLQYHDSNNDGEDTIAEGLESFAI